MHTLSEKGVRSDYSRISQVSLPGQLKRRSRLGSSSHRYRTWSGPRSALSVEWGHEQDHIYGPLKAEGDKPGDDVDCAFPTHIIHSIVFAR